MEVRIVQLKNDPSGIDDLWNLLKSYYKNNNRDIKYLSSGTFGRGNDEGDHYFVNFLLDRKYVLKYSIPTAIRTFALLSLGVGPEFVPLELLVSEDRMHEFNFSMDSTTEAVEHNLALLDKYFETQK
jgi:hypothetical protein